MQPIRDLGLDPKPTLCTFFPLFLFVNLEKIKVLYRRGKEIIIIIRNKIK